MNTEKNKLNEKNIEDSMDKLYSTITESIALRNKHNKHYIIVKYIIYFISLCMGVGAAFIFNFYRI